MPCVAIESVTKSFPGVNGQPIRAVDELTLNVGEKEALALVGPSGCGKTTTLRLIAGLETPDSGNILLNDKIVNAVPPGERDVAMVFQSHALYPHMTARENIGFGLTIRRFPKNEIATRVSTIAELLGLVSLLDRKPAELSGGERQRVALGRALVRRPRVLLLDEPLSQLDTLLRARLRAEIIRLRHELELTMIYVTHDLAEAMAVGDRVALMRTGKLEQVGTPREIRDRPANPFVSEFLGTIPGAP